MAGAAKRQMYYLISDDNYEEYVRATENFI